MAGSSVVIAQDRPGPQFCNYRRVRVVDLSPPILSRTNCRDSYFTSIYERSVFVSFFCVRPYGAFRRCDHLIQLGIEKGMQRAQIIPYGGNQLIDSSTRTNTAAWLNYRQDAVVARVENSIASLTKSHPLDGESLQILHYGNGQV